MAHKTLIDLLLCAVCLAVAILSGTFIVLAEQSTNQSARPESFAVFAAGIGLTGVGFVVRRQLRSREKS